MSIIKHEKMSFVWFCSICEFSCSVERFRKLRTERPSSFSCGKNCGFSAVLSMMFLRIWFEGDGNGGVTKCNGEHI